jgi:hypothetical protein
MRENEPWQCPERPHYGWKGRAGPGRQIAAFHDSALKACDIYRLLSSTKSDTCLSFLNGISDRGEPFPKFFRQFRIPESHCESFKAVQWEEQGLRPSWPSADLRCMRLLRSICVDPHSMNGQKIEEEICVKSEGNREIIDRIRETDRRLNNWSERPETIELKKSIGENHALSRPV